MRRRFGPRGGAARRDAAVAADGVASTDDGAEIEARAAFRQAKKEGGEEKKEDSEPRMHRNHVKGGGQMLVGREGRTGIWSRCFRCDSEYHLATGRTKKRFCAEPPAFS